MTFCKRMLPYFSIQNESNGFSRGSSKRHRSPTPHGTSPHRASPHGSLGVHATSTSHGSSDLTVTINSKGRSVSQDGGPSVRIKLHCISINAACLV